MHWRTKDRLARVASTYRNAIADGGSPVDAVALELKVGYDAAKQQIYRARRAGHDLLPTRRP